MGELDFRLSPDAIRSDLLYTDHTVERSSEVVNVTFYYDGHKLHN